MPLNHCSNCNDCTPGEYPICGGTPVHICVYRKGDPQPLSAWAAAFCDTPGNENIRIFEDRELTIPMPNYSWESRVPCSHPGGLGTNCGNPTRVFVCNPLEVTLENPEITVDFTDVIDAITNTSAALLAELEGVHLDLNSGLSLLNTSVNTSAASIVLAVNNSSSASLPVLNNIFSEIQSLHPGISEAATNPGFDTNGNPLPAEFWTAPRSFTYSSGKVATITATVGVDSWTRTLTYAGDDLTGISGWVKNP